LQSVVFSKKFNAKAAIKREEERRRIKYDKNVKKKQKTSHARKVASNIDSIPDAIKEYWKQIQESHLAKLLKNSNTSRLDNLEGMALLRYVTICAVQKQFCIRLILPQ
jgi:phage terminase Nu1 subunit (DNA packaging protein)